MGLWNPIFGGGGGSTEPGDSGIADGDYGDVVVTGDGTVLTVDDGAITEEKLSTDIVQRIEALESVVPGGVTSGNYIVQGGELTWNGGFDYTVSAAEYVIGGVSYASPETDLTLAASDPTNARIDVFTFTTSNTVVIVQGTPAASPAKPELDPTTELEDTFVLVAAASVASPVTNTDIYLESTEWTDVSSSVRIVVNSTNNPFSGTVCIEATAAVAGDTVTLTNGAPIIVGNLSNLTIKLRSKATWASQKRLQFQWRSGVSNVGNAVQIRPSGTYGFVSSTTGVYQAISIPITDFGVGLSTADNLLISVVGGGAAFGWYLDEIVGQAGVPGSGSNVDPAADMTFKGAFVSTAAYDAQDVVTSDGSTYVAIQGVPAGTTPPNAVYWTAIGGGGSGLTVNNQTGNYTTLLTDAGKIIRHTSSAGSGDTITIDSQANVAWVDGTCLTFDNRDLTNNLTIAITTDTLRIAGSTITGSYTLRPGCVTTAVFSDADNEWVIGATDTITVAEGGTGVATLTAYAPVFGGTTSTGAVQSGTVGTAGQALTSNGAGALPTFQDQTVVNFTSALATASPNATVNVASLTPVTGTTSVDFALCPKGGSGALMADIPDSAATGGNKRGSNAVDWQSSRASAGQVASGTQSTIGGGHRNTASSAYATVAGGNLNIASTGDAATVAGGESNTASNTRATVGGGASNTASAISSTIPGGFANTADGDYSIAMGRQAVVRGTYGASAFACYTPGSAGDTQRREFVLVSDTTSATPEAMTTDNTAAGTNDQIVLPNASLFSYTGEVVVRENATGDSSAWKIEGAIKRGANAAATALLGTPTVTLLGQDAGAVTWTFAITADTTNGALAITVTGEASHTLRWVARVVTTEVVG